MKTLYDKLWEEHHVTRLDTGESLLYIDRHYLHEVTSPQAFEGLSKKNLKPWRLEANIATPDHNVPTTRGSGFNSEKLKTKFQRYRLLNLIKIAIHLVLNNLILNPQNKELFMLLAQS